MLPILWKQFEENPQLDVMVLKLSSTVFIPWCTQLFRTEYSPSSVTLSTTEPNTRMSVLPSVLPPRPLSLLRPVGPKRAKPRTRYSLHCLLNHTANAMKSSKSTELQHRRTASHNSSLSVTHESFLSNHPSVRIGFKMM